MIQWRDAKSEVGTYLDEFIKKGFMINKSVGWLRYFDKEKVIISSECSNDTKAEDLTMIPCQWIIGVDLLE